MKPGLFLSILLAGVAVLAAACSRNISVSPNPIFLYTHTPTCTNSPTATISSTPTSTPSTTLTYTPTTTSTASFTPTRTFTPTPSPSDTPTDTPTATPTQGIVCTPTPPSAVSYTELEPPGQGGPTGTNDSCATAENIGTVFTGAPLVISGSLNPAGAGAYNGDTDYYFFTAGSAGTYSLTVDCYSTGTDNNLLDLVIFDTGCNYLYDPGATQPVISVTSPALNPGDSYYFMITSFNGTAPLPYHFTISTP